MALLSGKRVLVTGSTRGIGRATAELFLAKGAEVIVHGRSRGDVDRTIDELGHRDRITGHAADLARRGETKRLAEEAGAIDILVNCAGIYIEKSIINSDEAFFDRTIEINLTAGFLLSRSLLPSLRQRRGVIVNVSSDAGLLGYGGSSVYAASKGAVIGLTKALAVELAPDVRALCICPGPVATDMMENAVKATSDPEAARRQWASFPLLGRVARPSEIAEAIVFAASPAASFATGSIITIDGGTTAGKRV
ncbi:SDR family NAD(P)-dependent oxidoreductase [Taklimakanibacter deserti]|uniref:SDR family NAD(P)-dependent oxidoreductase n=1 Tax=Taklimakanibacter deserti TaxID=2267839 RepID=UPI000E651A20